MQPARKRWRQFWLALHCHLGLWLGLLFAVAGLSGSLLVFYVEIDQWLNPRIALATAAPPPSLQPLASALQAAHPGRGGAWRIEMPLTAGSPLTARYDKPEESRGRKFAPLLVSLDAGKAAVTGSRFWGRTAMTWLYDLHYLLLIDGWGATLMGVTGLLLALSLLSGLALWWPANGNWRSALRLRWQAGTVRRTYDLHKFGGIAGGAVLLVLALSGFALSLPGWANPLISWFSPVSARPHVHSQQSGGNRIGFDAALGVARSRFPGAAPRWVESPADEAGSYLIRMYQEGEPGRRFPRTLVWVDQYSGAVLAQQDARRRTAGDELLAWLHPLHSGEAFGLPGRIIVLLSGLILPLTYLTGLLRWRQKRRAQQRALQQRR